MTEIKWIGIPKDISIYVGFVYEIKEIHTGMLYYGIKKFWKIEKKKPTKFSYDDDGKVIKYKIGKKKGQKKLNPRQLKIHTKKETNWKTYNSSSILLQEKIEKNPNNYRKEIITCCYNVTDMKAEEVYIQLQYYLNGDWDKLYNECVNLRLRIRKKD